MNNKVQPKNIAKGMFWATMASALWGVSGTILEFISQGQKIPATWFLSVRTLGAGLILLIIGAFKFKLDIFSIFKSKRLTAWLIAYALFGIMGNLYTFFMSIQTGNAATATILQYLSPLFIVLGTLAFTHKWPNKVDLIAFGIALVGVFLAITKGNISTLTVPLNSLIWGVLSGVTAAFYVVLPKPIVEEKSPILVLGWGMFISGVLFNIYRPFWQAPPTLNASGILAILAVILIGTVFAFLALLHSLNFAPSTVVSIVDAIQPIITFILSMIFFHTLFSWVELAGAVLVIVAIYVLQRYQEAQNDPLA
ncbi:DMT family transporter [Latilactobacillus fuchuensis]|uniref:EamA domain-containing protein n=2 Tax=Latilactobacillus fuchuensis TaxID=164393 RepID=A0A2N9DYD7_9LACO|nr:DMT family transporter [Latilactobacillus fuchuensis]KRL59828.1 hypothetical protein FC69_GL001410 [Latilactobacillus fuchuensis DSM 14340 = JCM 11249]SPC40147.1 conserved membrane hypothetical protein [Latilactobacillus fuchuensis]